MINLGDLTSLAGKPIAAISNTLNTPNSAGRNRPFYWQNLIDTDAGPHARTTQSTARSC